VARVQQGDRVRRIGVFVPGSVRTHGKYVTALRNALGSLGYSDGNSCIFLIRWGEGNFDRFSDYALELIEARPEVVLTTGTPVTSAVRRQTATIPVVFVQIADPITGGFVTVS
jgi:putative ABC transport system substrate-binding protein